MIVITGAAGFIGANLVAELNAQGEPAVAVDTHPAATPYLSALNVADFVPRDAFPSWLDENARDVKAVLHMGACSDTTCTDREFLTRNNFEYTRTLWKLCAQRGVRLVYASSAATYGDGSNGYDDRADPSVLRPLNLYGESKQQFDLWALEQVRLGKPTPAGWAGLKFFNVYGPRENHKGRMASVAFHAYNQIQAGGRVKLFASDRPDVPDGGQMRDFVYVKDVAAAVLYCSTADAAKIGALLNVGTGKMRSFADLACAVFSALGREPQIDFIPMPDDLKGRYQYFTEARIEKLRDSGFTQPFHSLEDGVRDYVNFLQNYTPK